MHRPDGAHVKGLNPLNDWVAVGPGESVELYVEAAANPHVLTSWRPTFLGDKLTAPPDPVYRLATAAVVEVDPEVRSLLADLEVLDRLAAELGEDDVRQVEILLALEAALDALDLSDVPATASGARGALAAALARPAYDGAHRISAVGHAHIDSAWLWPVRETVRKVTRTVANVVNLLDEAPDLVYAMSSAQQWEWVRTEHPALFARVKEHVAEGRFVPVGGMWVESDTNMVGGEAMARQFLVGQRWFEEHLGTTCDEVWLPDSFGYTAALPQIVRQAGCRWFLTQKISWNTTNVFPHHTFWWEGIDGTRVFTHFPPVDTYTAELTGAELAHAARNFRDKGAATRSLVPFGHGDGGGGPTREMLGRASRTASLAGSPVVTVETPRAFFEAAEAEYADAPVWAGELYLEIHRGTYTSQAAMKQGNRRSEHLLREAELWSATAAVRGVLDYPADELDRLWKIVLLHQFHDILPGSSIAWVHREARATYASVAADLEALIDRALDALAGDGADEVVFNAGPVARDGVAALGATSVVEPGERQRARVDDRGPRERPPPRRAGRGWRDPSRARQGARPRGAAAGRGREPAPAAPRPPGQVGRLGPRPLLPHARLGPHGRRRVARRRHGHRHATRSENPQPGKGSGSSATASRSRPRSTGTSASGCSRRPSTSTCTPTTRRTRRSSATWSGRPTRTPPGTRRASRCAPTGGCTWASPGTASRSPTTRPTATTSPGTHARAAARSRACDSACCARRCSPTRRPTRGGTCCGTHSCPAPGSRSPPRPGTRSTSPCATVAARPSSRWSGVEGTAYVEAVKLAADGSGDVVVRLYEPLGARTSVRVTASFAHTVVTEVDLLERPMDSGSWDGERLTLRPFQIVTLRFARS